uniref:Uncharacterized protein n=1 Tax=Candidatus Kentrum sp. TUN TaxID=2126343 RepID=A0A450ZRP7_9GAMM|nr:MAG: hypothetical protein BECKTUN1418F_GA0071002_101611 [Candidatus Kentron sp. TUN]VFK53788.1 MAG: hypothetical protein BECKTUN1418E_GA0071001_101811 [Candidatus Kentron sp. TUN]VFK56499.1 MAG: hypothetical protein BECKTUN1418D_GA0071000_10485 [Candidatus Kentron sp. TUN]
MRDRYRLFSPSSIKRTEQYSETALFVPETNILNMLALRAKADRKCFFNRTPIFSEFLFFRYLKKSDYRGDNGAQSYRMPSPATSHPRESASVPVASTKHPNHRSLSYPQDTFMAISHVHSDYPPNTRYLGVTGGRASLTSRIFMTTRSLFSWRNFQTQNRISLP